MSDTFDEIKNEYLTKLKKVKLIEAGVDIDEVEKYVKFVSDDSEEEIEVQAKNIVADINGKSTYIDQHVASPVWKPFK